MVHIDLQEDVAVVTGGAAGIGLATVELLAKSGAKVGFIDIDQTEGAAVEKRLKKEGKEVLFVHGSTGDEKEIERTISQIAQRLGDITILVNGACKCIMKSIDATMEDWVEIVKTGVAGYSLCTKYCLPHMKKTGKGAIVNICSISAMIAQPNFVTYAAVKGAVLSMTRCMALDLAKYNIRVNCVSPGTTWTKANAGYIFRDTGLDLEGANASEEIGGAHVLHRVAQPEEIGNSILYLCSPLSTFMTGSNLVVDGGYTAK